MPCAQRTLCAITLRRHSGIALEKLAERRLIRKMQVVGNGLYGHVCIYKQTASLGIEHARNKIAGCLLSYLTYHTRQISGRNRKPARIEIKIMLLTIMLYEQKYETVEQCLIVIDCRRKNCHTRVDKLKNLQEQGVHLMVKDVLLIDIRLLDGIRNLAH